ncbi:2-hydroxychromene-2-carboxylate isomerase [Paraburkholderia phosphatilytica]|uniref:2-hydroxychromene-2-carboxylate isomerase n=1 Tax=Paraburkholderia phosphatilytica TaxID=2282883 RepID=UPI000E480434|nr:2-hydroxychromene-2-carboxylate isomerase [Paraburkholderia phosphatilytica]
MTQGIDATQPRFFYDFVSPFSYLLLEQYDKWPNFPFVMTPVMLYDLYQHWGQRPAYEVPTKRGFIYRHALFRAEQLGIPFRMPPLHPFDSTNAMLLAIAGGGEVPLVREIFRFIWREGHDPSVEENFKALCERVGISDGHALAGSDALRHELTNNTEQAIRLGVFGVPTFRLNNQMFWGEDALPMVLYCARTPNWLDSKEVKRISKLAAGRPGTVLGHD